MSSVYVPNNLRTSELSNIGASLLIVLGIFAVVPLLIAIPSLIRDPNSTVAVTTTIVPPTVIEPLKVEPVETQTTEKPEVEPPLAEVDITMIEKMLTPGYGNGTVDVGFNQKFEITGDDFKPFMWDKVDPKPRVLVAIKPIVPYDYRNVSAEVTIEFIIDENGKVLRPRVVSSTNRAFDQAALDAVERSKWQPGELNGKPVPTIARLPVVFKK